MKNFKNIVLILILMEHSLTSALLGRYAGIIVLILILMEHSLTIFMSNF